jgi:hypothetical protein
VIGSNTRRGNRDVAGAAAGEWLEAPLDS